MIDSRKATAVTAVLVFVSSILSYYAGAIGFFAGVTPPTLPSPMADRQLRELGLDTLANVQRRIQQDFFEAIEPQALTDGAVKGMVEAIDDPYSAYFAPEEFKAFIAHFDPTEFSGIGVYVEMSTKTELLTVVSPIEGSPGDKAGLLPGDGILTVDGRDIKGMALEQAVNLIKGPVGTAVSITVKREGVPEPLEFTITRATIVVPAVVHRMVDQQAGVGYIQIREFKRKVNEDVDRAIADLKSLGATRLVLDLRRNPGGLLDQAIAVSSIFLPPNLPVVHIVQRAGEQETYSSVNKAAFTMPLVVLVDEHSASASEIVAGAIKDNQAGLLVGMKTFGKGSVQTPFDLPNGGGLKLTTARYLTAGEHSIHGVGIDPDVIVEHPEPIRLGDAGDLQLAEAIRQVKQRKR
jgi:carboxyl-terminal processing protease